MADHFIGLARGTDGFALSDFTYGTTSTATLDVEVRIANLDQQSVAMNRIDVLKMLEAIERIIESGGLGTTFPPL